MQRVTKMPYLSQLQELDAHILLILEMGPRPSHLTRF